MSRFFSSESFLFSFILFLKIVMSKEILQVNQQVDPESYDILKGTPVVERIFIQTYCFPEHRSFPVFTRRVNEVIRRGSYWMKHVRYPYFALEMILEGEMEFQTEEQRQIAGPGMLYLIPPGTTVRFTCLKGKPARKLCAIMDGSNLKGILLTLRLSNSRLVRLSQPEVIADKLRSLKDAVASPGSENSARSFQFLLDLSDAVGEDTSGRTPLRRAVAILESNFQENLQIPEIAAAAGVSESTLRRMFHSELHCSPLEYLNGVRLKFASEKLVRTGLRIKEIAQMSGFLSSARFCTVFQEKYRMTPGDFRKQEGVMNADKIKGK